MSFMVNLNREDIMLIKAALFYCISFLASTAWTQTCSGKLIANNICIPKEYTNRGSQSFPNLADVFVELQRVILLDINPKKKKISVHIDFFKDMDGQSFRIAK